MSAETPLPFDELFGAVGSDALAALHALILKFPQSLAGKEAVYKLLNWPHPQKKLTVLQWAVGRYPKTSLRVISILLDYGAGTELPNNTKSFDASTFGTPLWMAISRKLPVEVVRLLLNYKADIFFKSNLAPFSEDEKSNLSCEKEVGFTLLHLAAKVGTEETVFKLILDNSHGLLLNDQTNHLRQTALMISVKEKNVLLTRILLKEDANVQLRDLDGLTAYETAAKAKSTELCSLFTILPDYNYVLEVVEKINESTWKTSAQVFVRDLDGADDLLLPIDGYWEWCDSWLQEPNNLLCRLRKRVEITDQFYLQQSIDLVKHSQSQKALNILLEGLQHETDPLKKSRAASYFQRLLQTVEKSGANALGLIDNLSRSNLVILGDEAVKSSSSLNSNVCRLPPVTREFPQFKSKVISTDSESDYESDDSLLYCPVCSHRFSASPSDRSSHLQSCLNSPRHRLIGDRYTDLTSNTSNEECPICYEKMCDGVVVMNCLCKFHGKCIENWLKRGKQCPYHHE